MTSERTRFSPLRGPIASMLAIAVAAPLATSPAFAAEADKYEEIIVTAFGRETSLEDSPAAVTVIGQSEITRKGVERVEDFVALVPGMSVVNAAEVADTQINIRGLNGARDAEVNYALVVDGVVLTNPAALNREWGNLQQIEVLKGPQSALYGRNAAAGAIIMTTQLPTTPFEADTKVSYGENNTWLLSGRVGAEMNDEWTWQLAGTYRDTDGFRRESFTRTDDTIDNFRDYSVDARVVWSPNDKVSVDTKLRYGEVNAASIMFNSLFHIPSLVGVLQSIGQSPEMAAFGYEDVNGHDPKFYPNIESSNEQEAFEASIKVDYDLGWADFIGWGLYSDIDNSLGADGTSGAFGFFFTDPACIQSTDDNGFFPVLPPQVIVPQDAFGPGTGGPAGSLYGAYTPTTCDGTQYQERNQTDYSFEARLRSKDDQRLRWEAGLYYLNIQRDVGVNLGIDTGEGLVEKLYTSNPINPTEQLLSDRFNTDVYAIFAQLNYDITDDLEAGVALRYDYEDRETKSRVPTAAVTQYLVCTPGDPFTGGAPINPGLCIDPTGRGGNQSEDFNKLQPKGTLSWQATDRLNVFGSVGVGFKSGGFNNFGSAATVNTFINGTIPDIINGTYIPVGIADSYDEETSTAYELGFRTSIGDTLQFTGAGYYIDVDDMQFFEFFVGQFGLLRVNSNMDNVEIKGVELSGTWSPFEWLSLEANGNYIDSEIKDNDSRPDTEGNDSPYTPEYTFYLGADGTWPINADLDLIATVGVTGTGNTWFHSVQSQQRPTIFDAVFGTTGGEYSVTERDSFELVDLRVGVQGSDWTLVATGKNVLDKNYIREVIPAPEFGGSFDAPGDESWWGVEFTKSFGQ